MTDKEKLQAKVEKITSLVDTFCVQKLNEDYLEMAGKIIGKLKRKRPSPLLNGREEIWAAGIVHAIGHVNFLFDKSFQPYVTFDELNAFFGTKKSTVNNKSIEIREMLDMNRMTNFEYMTKDRKDSHPLYNMVMVDGFFVHISDIPEEYQKLVREAREKGEDISFKTR